MTELLAQALAALQKLSPDQQDEVARRILIDLADPKDIERQFEQSQELLAGKGEEALIAHRARFLKEKDQKKP